MPLTKDELVKRARFRSDDTGDYWDNVANMLDRKKGIDRASMSQRKWNWFQDIRDKLTELWEWLKQERIAMADGATLTLCILWKDELRKAARLLRQADALASCSQDHDDETLERAAGNA